MASPPPRTGGGVEPSASLDPSATLEALYQDDRREHANVPPVGTSEYRALRDRDRARRIEANAILSRCPPSSLSPADLYRAAWLFNHGDEPAECSRAVRIRRRTRAEHLAQSAALRRGDGNGKDRRRTSLRERD